MAAKTNTFYQVGSPGTIAVANTFANETLDPAHGTVTAAPGSPLAAIMGATSADAEGFLLHIDFTQTESLQAPAGDVPEMPMPAIALAVSTLGVGLLRRIGRDHWMR